VIERIPSCELRAGCLAIVLLCLGSSVGAGTLQTRFSTVTVHDLPIGRWTRVELAGGVPYTVENTSNRKVTVTLTPGRPFEPKSVGRGYEMIPDPKWITVKPAVLKLEPHSSGTAEVRLTIPDDPKYAGKRYEVWLMAKGAGPQFQVGLITRIRFNIVAEPTDRPPSKTDEKRKEQDPS
jgi:hypothetical protein